MIHWRRVVRCGHRPNQTGPVVDPGRQNIAAGKDRCVHDLDFDRRRRCHRHCRLTILVDDDHDDDDVAVW